MPKRRKPVALVPPPHLNSSRKKARQVTTLFHKYTRDRDKAVAEKNEARVAECDRLIESIGGRTQYQIASQISTSFFSTTKWVIGKLGSMGWLNGIQEPNGCKRRTRILEVGAINTQLLQAATQRSHDLASDGPTKYNLQVRAIDLHSMHPDIEEADFLKLKRPSCLYDVIVCSMVVNCVTTPSARGDMMLKLHKFVRIEGILFLTVPKSCLTLSRHMSREIFIEMLEGIGWEVVESKDSPKISFFVCKKVADTGSINVAEYSDVKTLYQGKKFTSDFGICFSRNGT